MLLQLIGVFTVWFDLTSTARKFGKGGFVRRTLPWLQAFFGRDVVLATIEAAVSVDRDKGINDTHGHLIGDEVLKASVRYLRGHLRPYDHVFRYGGEEFLILIPDTDLETGRLAIERIREGLAAAPLAQDGQTAVYATASFGVAAVDPDATIEESLGRADKMMYAAKNSGRNCVRVWRVVGAANGG